MELRGASVLLTGASGGLGGAIARRFHQEGAKLVLTGRNREILDELGRELGATVIYCDLTDRDELNALATAHADIDILISNAAVAGSGLLESFDQTEADRVIEANLTAPVQLARAIVPNMIERGRGHVVLVSSLAGKVTSPGGPLYTATKFGLRGFGLALRQDVADRGVGVSVLAPGFVSDAGMFAKSGATDALPPGIGTCTPEDVAEAAVTAIQKNRAEISVAPLAVRAGALIGAVSPSISAAMQRASGAHQIAVRMAEGQAAFRS